MSGTKMFTLMSSACLGCLFLAASLPAASQMSLDQRSIRFPEIASGTPRTGFCAMQKSQTTNPLAKIGTKAYSNPISTAQIEFLATTPATGTVTIRVQEGAMGKIIAVDAHSGYAIIPVVNPINSDQVDFTIMSLTVDDKGNESVRYLGKATGKIQDSTVLDSAAGLTLKLRSIVI